MRDVTFIFLTAIIPLILLILMLLIEQEDFIERVLILTNNKHMKKTVLKIGQSQTITIKSISKLGIEGTLLWTSIAAKVSEDSVISLVGSDSSIVIEAKTKGASTVTVSFVNEKGTTVLDTIEVEVIAVEEIDFVEKIEIVLGDIV